MADETMDPQATEPTPEPAPAKTEKSIAEEMLSELDRMGIKDPEQLGNMAKASSESGRLANMVGELRQQVQSMQQQQAPPQLPQQPQQYQDSLYEDPEERPLTRRELRDFYREIQDRQTEATKAAWGEYASIQQDPDYDMIKDQFEEVLKKPETQQALNLNQTTLRQIYNDTRLGTYRNLLMTMRGKLEGITEGSGKQTKPPHMESGQPAGAQISEPSERDEQLKAIEKTRTGSDDDIKRMLDAVLPPGELTRMRGR
jgi:CRISPR/Cas system CSM-associated protein Csm2 small subunit